MGGASERVRRRVGSVSKGGRPGRARLHVDQESAPDRVGVAGDLEAGAGDGLGDGAGGSTLPGSASTSCAYRPALPSLPACTRASGRVVSPGGVGFDISCGVRLLRAPPDRAELGPHLGVLTGPDGDGHQAVPARLGDPWSRVAPPSASGSTSASVSSVASTSRTAGPSTSFIRWSLSLRSCLHSS